MQKRKNLLGLAWKIPLAYLAATSIYIVVSDAAVARLVPPGPAQTTVQIFKGLAFVLGTSALLWALLHAALGRADRSARREAETGRTLASIAEWAPAAVWRVGDGDRLTYWNRRAAELFGWTPEEAAERTFADLAPDGDADARRASNLRDAVRRRVPLRLREVELTRRDGSVAVVGLSTAPLAIRTAGETPELLCVAVDLTPMKDAARRARLTEHTVRTAPEPVFWLRPDGTFLFANEATATLLGVTEGDLAGRHVQRFVPDFPLSSLAQAPTGESVSLELECTIGDRPPIPLWIYAGTVEHQGQQAVCVFARDVSEHKRLEDALRASEQHYRSLIESTSDSIVVLDAQGRLKYRNAGSRDLAGLDEDEVVGAGFWQYIHPDDADKVRAAVDAALREADTPRRVDFRVRHRCGGWRTVEAVGTAFDDASGERCLLVNSRDVTEPRRRERELATRAELSAWIADVGMTLTGRAELDDALQQSCDVTAARLEDTYCEIWVLDSARVAHRTAAAGPCLGPELREGLDAQDSVLEFVMRDGIHYTTNAAQQDSRIPEQVWLRRNEFVAFAGTPLYIEGRVEGALALFARRPLDDAVHDAARTVAHEIALAIHQRRAEAALVEQRRVLQNVLSNIPQGVFWKDRNGVFLGASQRLADALGIASPEQVVGRTDFDFSPPALAERFRADDRKVLESGEPMLDFEETLVDSLGRTRSLLSSKVPLRDLEGHVIGVLGIYADVTDLKDQQARLRRLAAAVDQVREGIVVTDAEGSIEYVNPAFEEITGYAAEEVLGRDPRILSSGQTPREHYEKLWSTICEGRTWNGNFINRRKDGSLYEEETTISPVRDERGEIVQFVGVKRDVSQRNRMEAELRQAQRMESIGGLAAGIAHEINTPIQYVGDNVRFLEDAFRELATAIDASSERDPTFVTDDLRELAEEVPDAIRQTLDGVQQVATIVRSMKEFAHPARDRRAVELNRAVESTVAVARNEWKHVAEVRLELDPDLPRVEWVPAELNQVVLNLVVNAAQAIGEDRAARGVEERGKIEIRTRVEDGHVVLEVEDDGPGIPPEIRSRIFEPFFTTKEPGKGTGQGLSILHRLVSESYGGAIEVASETGHGTRFTIRLPFSAADAGVLAAPQEPT